MAEGGLQFTDKTIEEINQFQYDYLTPEPPPVDRLRALAEAIDREIGARGKCYLRIAYVAGVVAESYRRIPAVAAHLSAAGIESEIDRWLMLAKCYGFEIIDITTLMNLVESTSTEGVAVLRRGVLVPPDRRHANMIWEYQHRFELHLRELVRQIEFPVIVDWEELATLTGKIFR